MHVIDFILTRSIVVKLDDGCACLVVAGGCSQQIYSLKSKDQLTCDAWTHVAYTIDTIAKQVTKEMIIEYMICVVMFHCSFRPSCLLMVSYPTRPSCH